jgi:hypothetical protein
MTEHAVAKAKSKPKSKAKPKAKKGKGKRKKKTKAQQADHHLLYQNAVQTPEADVEFFTRVFKELRGRKPKALREDFCGSAYLSSTWVASAKTRTATGIDIEQSVLDWGREHNVAPLGDAAERVTLHCANVLDGVGDQADVCCAMNFSYQVFHTRELLKQYFKVAYDKLVDDGLFFTELYGGFEGGDELEEERECDGFTYIWQQAKFNPIDHRTLCHIHFEFDDGSKIKKAFTYDWRLWSIPELRELLEEVGFSDVKVYWEAVDEDGDGTGEFYETKREENQESWLVYIVGVK